MKKRIIENISKAESDFQRRIKLESNKSEKAIKDYETKLINSLEKKRIERISKKEESIFNARKKAEKEIKILKKAHKEELENLSKIKISKKLIQKCIDIIFD